MPSSTEGSMSALSKPRAKITGAAFPASREVGRRRLGHAREAQDVGIGEQGRHVVEVLLADQLEAHGLRRPGMVPRPGIPKPGRVY
jgi:hypothetical protein